MTVDWRGTIPEPRRRELWRTDGTAAGTMMIKDIRPGRLGALVSDERFGNRLVLLNGYWLRAPGRALSPCRTK